MDSSGDGALDAAKERLKRRNTAEYHRLNGTIPPDRTNSSSKVGISIQMAADNYLAEIERGVASYNERKGALQLAQNTLKKFIAHSKVQYLSEVTVAHLDIFKQQK